MKLHDRQYQTEATDSIWHYFRNNSGNPLVGMPTGTGKSVVIARFLESVYKIYPQQRIQLLTHVKELIQQNYEKLMMLWPFAPAGIYSAGLGRKDTSAAITFAGIASIYKKWALFGHVDLILIDEAHLLSPNDQTMYRQYIQGLKSINPNIKVVGFTATPWRLGHGHLTDPWIDKKGNEQPPLFTDMCFDITNMNAFNRLIAEGYLSPLIPKKTKLELSTDGLHMRGGEFIEREMQDRFDRDDITEAALREAIELGHNRNHWLVFGSGIEHAENICDMLNMLGVPAGVVHSKRKDRDETIDKFKRGEIRAVVNNNVLTTGFDMPGIDLILMLRATSSSVLWVQMLGRGTRPLYAPGYDLQDIQGRLDAIAASEKQDCLVLDYARNTQRLGPVNDPVVPRRKGEGGGEAPVKECPVCECFVHASLRWCNGQMPDGSNCTNEFTFEVKFKAEAATDELIKGDMPIVEVFEIDHVAVDKHQKMDRPDMMRFTYYSGLRSFSEYVCVEHENYAGRKARKWWAERSSTPVPKTTAEALDRISDIAVPTHLRIWINKKYPEIMGACFDGSAFGTQEPNPFAPQIENHHADRMERSKPNYDDLEDDDIPF